MWSGRGPEFSVIWGQNCWPGTVFLMPLHLWQSSGTSHSTSGRAQVPANPPLAELSYQPIHLWQSPGTSHSTSGRTQVPATPSISELRYQPQPLHLWQSSGTSHSTLDRAQEPFYNQPRKLLQSSGVFFFVCLTI